MSQVFYTVKHLLDYYESTPYKDLLDACYIVWQNAKKKNDPYYTKFCKRMYDEVVLKSITDKRLKQLTLINRND